MDIAINSRGRAPNHQTFRECRYSVVSERLYHIDLGEYHTYGIKTMLSDNTDILHDVSVCEKTVEYIVELLNWHRASPVHLLDIVMDFLP